MIGLFQENGPCFVNVDSNSTTLNEFAWNREVNMLFIDQPVQTGFSYDSLTNATLDLTSGEITPLSPGDEIPEQDLRERLIGTYPSLDQRNTLNTTENAAKSVSRVCDEHHYSQFTEHCGILPKLGFKNSLRKCRISPN